MGRGLEAAHLQRLDMVAEYGQKPNTGDGRREGAGSWLTRGDWRNGSQFISRCHQFLLGSFLYTLVTLACFLLVHAASGEKHVGHVICVHLQSEDLYLPFPGKNSDIFSSNNTILPMTPFSLSRTPQVCFPPSLIASLS